MASSDTVIEHHDSIRRAFAAQAGAFEDPARAFRSGDVIDWIRVNTPTAVDDVVLEVAAGTAIVGRALAPHVRSVLALDLTAAMLAEGKRAAEREGLANVVFQSGDAAALPFLDDSFDRVVCRLAVHHFSHPAGPLAEMVRVCRPTGTVTVIDMVADDDGTGERLDELERPRDPSHVHAHTLEELLGAVQAAGAVVVHTAAWEHVQDPDRWLRQTATPPADEATIRAAWAAELGGGPPTGMKPRRAGAELQFVHDWALVVARPS